MTNDFGWGPGGSTYSVLGCVCVSNVFFFFYFGFRSPSTDDRVKDQVDEINFGFISSITNGGDSFRDSPAPYVVEPFFCCFCAQTRSAEKKQVLVQHAKCMQESTSQPASEECTEN